MGGSAWKGSGPRSTRPRAHWPAWPRRPGKNGPGSIARRSTWETVSSRSTGRRRDRRRAAGDADLPRSASTVMDRVMLELVPAREPGRVRGSGRRLGPGDLVVITGGARGITAEIAVALARALQPRLLLLGRSPEPGGAAKTRLARRLPRRGRAEAIPAARAPTGSRSPQSIGEQRPQDPGPSRDPRQPRPDRRGRLAGRLSIGGRPRPDGRARRRSPGPATSSGRSGGSSTGPGSWPTGGSSIRPTRSSQLVYDTKVEGLHNLFDAIDPEALEFLLSLLVVDGSVRPSRPGGLRGRQRVPQQVGATGGHPTAGLPRRLVQLGTLGGRDGRRRTPLASSRRKGCT